MAMVHIADPLTRLGMRNDLLAIPMAERGPLRDWAQDLLSEPAMTDEGYFSSPSVLGKWHQHLAGTHDWTPALWSVLMFQAWREAQAA